MQDDDRAGGLAHDLVDQLERVLGAVTEPDEGDVGALTGGDGAHVVDLDLARDHLVSEGGHDRGDESQPILSLVGDQDTEMLGLAIAHLHQQVCAAEAFTPWAVALYRSALGQTAGEDCERKSGQLRATQIASESAVYASDIPVGAGCGPGGRGFESRRSPSSSLQITIFCGAGFQARG